MLGWYIPFQEQNNVSVNADRIDYWLSQGAQISDQVEAILAREAPSVLKAHKDKQQNKRVKMTAKRRALKKKA
jgi:ribosomal protein S16